MAQDSATSADVPGRFDVCLNGVGYMLLQTLEPSIPFRTHRAIYSSTQTFLERTNVGAGYGDNAQDFFLTDSQHDWSEGEQQRFMVSGDPDAHRRYWMGNGVDVTIPGQVSLRPGVKTVSFAGSVMAGANESFGGHVQVADFTNFYQLHYSGGVSTVGAHGLGVLPQRCGVATDGFNFFFGSASAGNTGVRMLVGGTNTFQSFSATAADALEYLNNALYGTNMGLGTLQVYDTSGNATTVGNFKDAVGGTARQPLVKLKAFGGDLLILMHQHILGGELWLYDGVGPKMIARFPSNFVCHDMDVLEGIVYVGGSYMRVLPGGAGNAQVNRPAVFYFANGTIGELWQATNYGTVSFTSTLAGGDNGSITNIANHPSVAVYDGGIVFNDDTTGHFMFYNPGTGGVSSLGQYTVPTPTSTGSRYPMIISGELTFIHTRQQQTAYIYPDTSFVSSATVASSLFDFGNTLNKVFRGVKVDWIAATDGNGGSVDVAYQVDSVDGSYTSLVNSVTSGAENIFTNVTGRSISIQVTLNRGTSTKGPLLKRVYLRAAPLLQSFKNRTYILDLSGIGFRDPVRDATNAPLPLSGHEQAQNLITAITSSVAFSVSDRFINLGTSLQGTTTADSFTALCEPADCEIYDTAEGWDNVAHPGGYVAKITVREI